MSEFYLLLLFGYLIGSLSPGYFFGRLVRGIDIRNYRNHNTGATNTYFIVGPVYGVIAGLFAKRKTKFGGGGKALLRLSATDGQARAGKNSFPPTPFLFARPSVKVFQNSASGFSLKKVRILFKTDSYGFK